MIGIFKHLKLNQIFKQALLVLSVWLLAFSVKGDTVQLGDLAPRGAIDGQLNVGDLVIMQRLVSGITVPTADELIIGDVAPLGASDGLLNAADFLILQRAILGQVTLGTVIIAPPAPTLDPVVISPTNENPYTVSGTSVADAVVDIYLNSALATTTTALPDGSFSTTIVLAEGLNTIEATANTGGDTSALSTAINVDFQLADGGTLSGNVGGMALATNTRYIVTADITVDANQTLVIEQGAELRFAANAGINVADYLDTFNASLQVNGTAQNPVVFTSDAATPAVGDWKGIVIGYGGSSVLDGLVIEYAVVGVYYNNTDYYYENVPSYTGYPLMNTLTNSIIRNNITGIKATGNTTPLVNGNGIYSNGVNYEAGTTIWGTSDLLTRDATGNWWGTADPAVIAASITDYYDSNDSYSNGLVDFSGFLSAAGGTSMGDVMPPVIIGTKTYNSGSVYVISDVVIGDGSSVYPNLNASLVINAGVEVRITGNYAIKASDFSETYSASLTINGTVENPVVFTSEAATPAAGDWQGIEIGYGSSSTIDNALIEYAAIGIYYNDSDGYAGSALVSNTLNNSIVRNNTTGIKASGRTSPDVTGNQITGNTVYYDASTAAVYDGNIKVLNATGNWWGTNDPAIIAAAIDDYYDNPEPYTTGLVDFSGFLNAAGGASMGAVMPPIISGTKTYNSGKVYVISDVLVRDNTSTTSASLTFNAGVEVRVAGNYKITASSFSSTMSSIITVAGTATDPVVFTSNQSTPAAGDWQGIEIGRQGAEFGNGYASIQIDNAVIEYATDGIYFNYAYPVALSSTVSNSIIRYNTNGIHVYNDGAPLVQNNEIYANEKGLYVHNDPAYPNYNSSPTIVNNNSMHTNTWNYFAENMQRSDNGSIPVILNARDNWWGTADPFAIAATIYDYMT
jgi:parallel beta-helix repeat protein